MKIKDLPQDERPREKLQEFGVDSLSNSELLALVLRNGSKKENVVTLANRILKENNLENLSCLDITDLMKTHGVGEVKACQIVACFELSRRLASFNSDKKPKIENAQDIAKLLIPKLGHLKKETLFGIYLNSRKQIIKIEKIFVGSVDSSIVHPREIFEPAIKESAVAIIIAHNHPSGDTRPSKEDIGITNQLIKAGELMDIELLDHLIIGKKKYFSFREQNLI